MVPAIGQGSGRLGQGRHPETAEEEALRTGISLGMSLIDTSGDYGNGRSENPLVARLLANVTVYSWSPKWKPRKYLETGWRELARPASLVSASTSSISICYIGQCQIPNSPTS